MQIELTPAHSRIINLYNQGFSQNEIAEDPELLATFLSDIENEHSRRWKIHHTMNFLEQLGLVTKRRPVAAARPAPPVASPPPLPPVSQETAPLPVGIKNAASRLHDERLQQYRALIRDNGPTTWAQPGVQFPQPLGGRDEWVLLGDPHIPTTRMDWIARIIERHRGANCLVGGDLYSWDRFTKKYLKTDDKVGSVQDDLQMGDTLMCLLVENFNKVELILGNHDVRPMNLAASLDPGLFWLTRHALYNLYQARHGVELIGHSVKLHDDHEEVVCYYQQIGDCIVCHIERSGSVPLKGARLANEWLHKWKNVLGLKPWRVVVQNHCFSEDTEVLTAAGWKTFDKIGVGQDVLTYNLNTGASEWNQVEDVVHYDHFKELVHFKSEVCDLLVTPDHAIVGTSPQGDRTLPFRRDEAKNWIGRRVKMPCAGTNPNPDYPIDDNLLRLITWVITEGTYLPDSSAIRIGQSQKEKVDTMYLTGICEAVGVPTTTRLVYEGGTTKHGQHRNYDHYTVRLCASEMTRKIRELAPDKKLPEWFKQLSSRQFELVFKELMLTDGCQISENCFQYPSKHEDEIDLMQALCAQNGYRSSKIKRTKQRKDGSDYHYWILCICRRDFSVVGQGGRLVPYEGKVWCASVQNQTLFVRRNGKVIVCGNTHKRGYYYDDLTHTHCFEVGTTCGVQQYALRDHRFGPVQGGYFHLVQEHGRTLLNESRLYSLDDE